MRLLFAGDFRIGSSSGYATILEHLLVELSANHDITLLGLSWGKREHTYPFQVIPSTFGWVPVQALRIHQSLRFDHIVLAMDVPRIQLVLSHLEKQGKEAKGLPPISAIFPIEAPPVEPGWALALSQLHRRFVISQFGVEELAKIGLDATFLPMTSSLSFEPTKMPLSEYVVYGDGKVLDASDGPIALTVADNQERKSLPVIAQAVKMVPGLVWVLVTLIGSPHGWTLSPLWERLEVADRVVMLNADLPNEVLSALYYRANCFVLASQAEGACLPLYEAMARGLPCVAPKHTAIAEALEDGRGVLVEPGWSYITPWGNVERYMVSPSKLAEGITEALLHKEPERLVEWIENRTWAGTATIVEEELDGTKEAKEPKAAAAEVEGLTGAATGDDAGSPSEDGNVLSGRVAGASDADVGRGVRLRRETADEICTVIQEEVE